MTADDTGSGGRRIDDIEQIDLSFESFRHFQSEYLRHLSNEGLFIKSADPPPPSTVVRFRIMLPDDFVLLEGTGVVIWVRDELPAQDLPGGMALRFVALGRQSRELIEKLVNGLVAQGGTPFDLEHAADAEAPPDVAARTVVAGPPTPEIRGPQSPQVPETPPAKAEKIRFTVRGETAAGDAPDQPVAAEPLAPSVSDEEVLKSTVPEARLTEMLAGETGAKAVRPEVAQPPSVEAESPKEVGEETVAVPSQRLELELADSEDEIGPVEAPAEPEADSIETARTVVDEQIEAIRRFEAPSAEDLSPDLGGEEDLEPGGLEEGAVGDPESVRFTDDPPGVDTLETAGDQPLPGAEERADVVRPPVSEPPFEATMPERPATEDAVDRPGLVDDRELLPAVDLGMPTGAGVSLDLESVPGAPPDGVGPEPRPVDAGYEFSMGVGQQSGEGEPPPLSTAGPAAPEPTLTPVASPPRRSVLRPLLLLALLAVVAAAAIFFTRDQVGAVLQTVQDRMFATSQEAAPSPAAGETATDADNALSEMEADVREAPVAVERPEEVASPPPAGKPIAAPGTEVVRGEPDASIGPASAVTSIRWEQDLGATVVVIEGDGEIAAKMVSVLPMDSPPRVLVRLRPIYEDYPGYQIEVGSAELERIRIGHHPEHSPPSLYVVLDLPSADCAVSDVVFEGRALRVHVAARE